MQTLFSNLPAIAHLLIGFFFVFFGVWNVYHWFATMETMSKNGVPHPYILLPIGILWETIAGAMIIGGMFVKLAALSLIPFTIISICMFHPFWKMRGEHRVLNFTIFLINLTVTVGALILLISPVMQFSDFLT